MKAVFVFNMPSSCKDCRVTCTGYTGKEYKEYCQIGHGRPDWCLLRPLPHSKQMENRWFSDDYSKGWNECLEEITREKK